MGTVVVGGVLKEELLVAVHPEDRVEEAVTVMQM